MTAWAKVGAKVVCVDAAPDPGKTFYEDAPVEGRIYTISRVFIGLNGCLSLEFDELRRSQTSRLMAYPCDIGYRVDRFRPIITKTQEQDITMFKSLLTDTPINETA